MTPLEYATKMFSSLQILVMVMKKEVSSQAIMNLLNILVQVIREVVIQQLLLAKEKQSKEGNLCQMRDI